MTLRLVFLYLLYLHLVVLQLTTRYFYLQDGPFVAVCSTVVRSRKNCDEGRNRAIFIPLMQIISFKKNLMSPDNSFKFILLQKLVEKHRPKDNRTIPPKVISDPVSQPPVFIFSGIGPNQVAVQDRS